MINVSFKKTHPLAILPSRNHDSTSSLKVDGDTGYDLFAVEDALLPASSSRPKFEANQIPPMEEEDFWSGKTVVQIGTVVVPVGLALADIQEGYWFRIEARSGLGFKHGIFPHFGVIDNQYRGDLGTKLYNLTGKDYQIKAGDRIAQIVFYPIIEAKITEVDDLTSTKRGDKGHGSSGK